jgi:two-component system sensor histidine kinase UhpB
MRSAVGLGAGSGGKIGATVSLFWRVFLLNGALLVGAGVVLAISPVRISTPARVVEELVLAVGVLLLLVVNYLLLRPVFAPLERLAERMRNVDLLRTGSRLEPTGSSEVVDLVRTYNEMIGRLEDERRESARTALAAQEGERKRVAVELHDEVGQTMTGVLLLLERVAVGVPTESREVFVEVQDAVRKCLDDVRRIAEELRPELLEHLGLVSALRSLSGTITGRAGLELESDFAHELPALPRETELAVYRIAQESLTNVARHAQATRVRVSLQSGERTIVLRVVDDGRGLHGRAESSGGGIRGMRERAVLIGAALTVDEVPGGGTEVRVEVPIEDGA